MSDLISRKKVISVLEQLEEHSLSGKMDISNAIYLLNNQPTAYDIDKVVEELEQKKEEVQRMRNTCVALSDLEVCDIENVTYERAIEIVKQEAEQYNNGWIPVEEELPETDKYILLSFSNFSIPCVGRYEEDENGGTFYVGDDDESCVSQDMFVNAWQPLPHPYQPKGER